MIDLRIKVAGDIIESQYDVTGSNKLSDIGLVICELEKMKIRLMDESEKCKPEFSIDKKPIY